MNFKKIKIICCILTFSILGFLSENNLYVLASEIYSPGEKIYVSIPEENFEYSNSNIPLEYNINYNNNDLIFEKLICKNSFDRKKFKIKKGPGTIDILYNPFKRKETSLMSECSFELKFKVKQKPKNTSSNINWTAKNINSKEIVEKSTKTVILEFSKNSNNCKLKNLLPSTGSLSPNFNSNSFDYTIYVPCNVKDIKLDAIPESDNLKITINRHKLCAPGKETNISVMVRNCLTKEKSVYHVKVIRAHNPEKSQKTRYKKSKNKKSIKKLKKKSKNFDKFKGNNNNEESEKLLDTAEDETDNCLENEENFEIEPTENQRKNEVKFITIIAATAAIICCIYFAFKSKKVKKIINKIFKK